MIQTKRRAGWQKRLGLGGPRCKCRGAGLLKGRSLGFEQMEPREMLTLGADIYDVWPDPRTSSVDEITIQFSDAVTGFDLADLTLKRDGGSNLLTGSQSLSSGDGGTTWTLDNLSSLTSTVGSYTLLLTASGSGIEDSQQNPLAGDASDTWAVEALPEVTLTATDATATEQDATTGQFTVSRSGSTANALTVYYGASGTADYYMEPDYSGLPNFDGMMGTGYVTIAAGYSSAVITITPSDDAAVESDETVILTVSTDAGYSRGTPYSDTVTIADNDVLPEVTLTATDATATEQDTTTGQFTVSRSGSTANALTVYYAASGTADYYMEPDYSGLPNFDGMMGTGYVTIAAGYSSAVITITPSDDAAVESDETVILTVSTDAGYSRGTPYSDTVTIADNDVLPEVTLTATDATATEQDTTTGQFTVSRSGSTANALTVYYAASGTADYYMEPDYSGLPNFDGMMGTGYVTIAAGYSSAVITITPSDDAAVESDETVILTVSTDAGYSRGTPYSDTVTIADNDGVNHPPTSANETVNTNEDTFYTFSANDFPYSDADSDDLVKVQIVTLATAGVLKLSGVEVTAEDEVAVGSIGNLTFHPAADANGAGYATFTFKVHDGTEYSQSAYTMTVDMDAVNDVPSFTKGADEEVLEDCGAQTVTGWATNLSAGPANEAGQTLEFLVSNDNNGLFAVQPAVAANGTLSYTPAADGFGSATVTVRIQNDGGTAGGGVDTSEPQTFSITVGAVNDVPSFTKGADEQVVQDCGAQTVAGWATNLSPGPGNEATQSVDFLLSNDNNNLFAVQPAVAANGTLTYTPASGLFGSATVTVRIHDDGGTANGGVDTSAPQTFTISVLETSNPPALDLDADNSGWQAGADFVATWTEDVGEVLLADTDATLTDSDSTHLVSLVVSITNLQDGAAEVLSADTSGTSIGTSYAGGVLTLSGSDTVAHYQQVLRTVTYDNSSQAPTTTARAITFVANDGVVDSNTGTTTLTVVGVNDAPTSAADTLTALEDDVYTFSAGDFPFDDVDGDSLAKVEIVTLATAGVLKLSGVEVTAEEEILAGSIGNLTFHPAADANGAGYATFTFKVHDGTVYSESAYTMTMDVTPVNDVPSFSKGGDQQVAEDCGEQSVSGWATNLSAGPANEASQALDFVVTNDNNGLFAVQPAVAANGTLSYTPAADAFGTAMVTVRMHDDGGTVNGGVDTSEPQTCTIAVTGVNDLPVLTDRMKGTLEDTILSFTAADFTDHFGDADPGDTLDTVKLTGLPAHGTLKVSGVAVTLDQEIALANLENLTYEASADYNGSDGLQWKGSDGYAYSASAATVSITVTAVNDAPSFTAGGSQQIDENSGPQTVTGWATGMTAGPADESAQGLTFQVVSNDKPWLFAAGPAVDASTGTLTYTPATDAHGVATIHLVVVDDAGTADGGSDTSAAEVFTITVNGVNHPPVVSESTKGTLEDTPLCFSAADFTAQFSDTDAGDALRAVKITGLPAQGTLRLSGVAVATDQEIDVAELGNLTYLAGADYNGTDSFLWKGSDGNAYSPTAATVWLTVTGVNDAPSFVLGADPMVIVDSGAHTIPQWPLNLSAGPADESGQGLTFQVVSNNHPELFSVPPAVNAATGDLNFTVAAARYGTAKVGLVLSDNGGVANGGEDSSAVQYFTITVNRFSRRPEVADSTKSVLEDGVLTFSETDFTSRYTEVYANEPMQKVKITSLPRHGTLLLSGQPVGVDDEIEGADLGNLTYQPASQYVGRDSLQWTGSDEQIYAFWPATMTLIVGPDGAVEISDSYKNTTADRTLAFTAADFAGNFSGPDGSSFQTIRITALPEHGTLAVASQAVSLNQVIAAADLDSLTYQPAAGYTGVDRLQWMGSDGEFYSTTNATLSIIVGPNHAPMAKWSYGLMSVLENGALAFTAVDFTENFADPDPGDSLQAVRITSLPQHGALALDSQPVTVNQVIAPADLGNLTYQPAADWLGTDFFHWLGSDGQLFGTTPETVTIHVHTPDEQPVAYSQAVAVPWNQSVVIRLGREEAPGIAQNLSLHILDTPIGVLSNFDPATARVTYTYRGYSDCHVDTVFRFTLTDENGLVSEEGEITLAFLSTLPGVSVEGIDNSAQKPPAATVAGAPGAAWDASKNGQFLLARTLISPRDPWAGPVPELTVHYTVSGSAVAGVDYTALSGTAVFAEGSLWTTIDVSPLSDALGVVGDRNVVVTLEPSIEYGIQGPPGAAVTVRDSGVGDAHKSPDYQGSIVQTAQDGCDGSLSVRFAPLGLTYTSAAQARPIVTADVRLEPTRGAETLTEIVASVNMDGVQSAPVYYSASGVTGNDLYRFAIQVDASSLSSGRHAWTMTITQRYSDGSSRTDRYYGQKDLLNGSDSVLGGGWALEGLDRLVPHPLGANLLRGNGDQSMYWQRPDGSFRADPRFETLYATYPGSIGEEGIAVGTWAESFRLRAVEGKKFFDSLGRLVEALDGKQNSTLYTYVDADGDGVAEEISEVVDAAHRVETFAYTDGRVSHVTDFQGRTTQLGYDGLGRLVSITQPDPDGEGPLAAPVFTFAYDTQNRLVSFTDAEGNATEFGYDFGGTLHTITWADGTTRTLNAVQVQALVETSEGAGSQTNPAPLVVAADVQGSLIDEADHQTSFAVDWTGQPVWVEDALGGMTTYVRDLRGRVLRMEGPDPDGAGPLPAPVTTYEYNDAGSMTRRTNPDGSTFSWNYATTFGCELTDYTDEMGIQTTIEGTTVTRYTPLGSVVTTSTSTPHSTLSSEPPAGLVASQTDPQGNRTEFTYNAQGLPIEIVYAVGTADEAAVEFEYDSAGNLTASIDELGRRTEYAYDALGRLIELTQPDPDGSGPLDSPVTTYGYDAMGRLIEMTDPLGRVTERVYDERGQRTQIIRYLDSAPVVTETTYTATGQVETITDPSGAVTSYAYDALGRQLSVTEPDPDGEGPLSRAVTEHTYDALGRVLSVTDPLGNVTSYAYEDYGRRVIVTGPDPDGSGEEESPVTIRENDSQGRLTSQTDALGRVTAYAFGYDYDVDPSRGLCGWSITVTEPDPDGSGPLSAPVTTHFYDLSGRNLMGVKDAVGNVTTYAYDHRNRLVEVTDPLEQTSTYAYSAAGELLRETDREGRVTEFGYDDLGRRTSETWKEGETTLRTLTYVYDAAGRLTGVSDPDASYSFSYDDLDRQTSITVEIGGLTPGVVLTQAFDTVGNRTSLAAEIGETADFVNTYSYDGLRRMVSVEQTGVMGGNAVAEKRVDFVYNADGRFSTITRYADLAGTELVAETEYTYDPLRRLTALTHYQGSTTLAGYTWTYDTAGHLIEFSSTVDGTATYSYNATGQLTGADYDFQTDEVYSYDGCGNRTNSGYSTDTNNRLLSDGTYNYEYDHEGNRIRRTNIATGEVTEYAWDHRNRLVQVTHRASLGGAATKTVEYSYDAFDRLVSRTFDPDGDGEESATSTYSVYDGQHVVLELDSEGEVDKRFLYGPAVDQVLAEETGAGVVEWLLADHQGTIRDVVEFDAGTGETEVVNHLAYDAFGNLTGQTNSAKQPTFTYTGRFWDADAGLYYYRARWYDAFAGRFISEDPMGFAAGDTNLQRYVSNSPLMFTDPTGMFEDPCIAVDVGAYPYNPTTPNWWDYLWNDYRHYFFPWNNGGLAWLGWTGWGMAIGAGSILAGIGAVGLWGGLGAMSFGIPIPGLILGVGADGLITFSFGLAGTLTVTGQQAVAVAGVLMLTSAPFFFDNGDVRGAIESTVEAIEAEQENVMALERMLDQTGASWLQGALAAHRATLSALQLLLNYLRLF